MSGPELSPQFAVRLSDTLPTPPGKAHRVLASTLIERVIDEGSGFVRERYEISETHHNHAAGTFAAMFHAECDHGCARVVVRTVERNRPLRDYGDFFGHPTKLTPNPGAGNGERLA